MFTKRGEYAHKAVMALPAAGRGYVKAKEIALRESIPLPFLKKLIGALKRKGIVETRTGKLGGVALRLDPQEISLWDIATAVEPP
jgi:Rrf2 family protein